VELSLDVSAWSGLESQHLEVSTHDGRRERYFLHPGHARLAIPLLPARTEWRVDFSSDVDFLLPSESRRRSLRVKAIQYVKKLRKPWEMTAGSATPRASGAAFPGHVEHVLVVAGPAGSGKSHLLEMLANGACPQWMQERGLTNLKSWTYLTERTLAALDPAVMPRVIVHLDLTSMLAPDAGASSRAGDGALLERLGLAKRLTIITVKADAAVLRRRNRARIWRARFINLLRAMGRSSEAGGWEREKLEIFERMGEFYNDPGAVSALYEKWFASCTRLGASDHLTISGTSRLSDDDFTAFEP
jgi:hypothetical protein